MTLNDIPTYPDTTYDPLPPPFDYLTRNPDYTIDVDILCNRMSILKDKSPVRVLDKLAKILEIPQPKYEVMKFPFAECERCKCDNCIAIFSEERGFVSKVIV